MRLLRFCAYEKKGYVQEIWKFDEIKKRKLKHIRK